MSDLIEFEAAYEGALRNSVPGTIKDIARLCWQASRAQPAQAGQVLTDDEIDPITMAQWGEMRGHPLAAHRAYARAIESAVLARVARVPMTPEEIDAALKLRFYPARNRAFIDGVEAAERHHGIVGEKGGA